MIFDTHAHYDDEAFDEDREILLDSMKENGIGCIVNACASAEHIEETIALMGQWVFTLMMRIK